MSGYMRGPDKAESTFEKIRRNAKSDDEARRTAYFVIGEKLKHLREIINE